MKTGNLVVSSVIALWGVAIIVSAVLRGEPSSSDAFGVGQGVALVLAVAMVVVGGLGIRKELRRRDG